MRFLRSQGVVLVLAAVAIFLVGKNLLWPMLGPSFGRRSGGVIVVSPSGVSRGDAVASASPPRAEPGLLQTLVNKVTPGSSGVPASPMNQQELASSSPAWVGSPQRDPFRRRGGLNDKSARELLTLTGILRQTESDLAVLNGRIMAAGETILDFRLETVEADRVWVSGPNGREMLEFKYSVQFAQVGVDPGAAGATNAAAGGR